MINEESRGSFDIVSAKDNEETLAKDSKLRADTSILVTFMLYEYKC
jgi:hypothetical protein